MSNEINTPQNEDKPKMSKGKKVGIGVVAVLVIGGIAGAVGGTAESDDDKGDKKASSQTTTAERAPHPRDQADLVAPAPEQVDKKRKEGSKNPFEHVPGDDAHNDEMFDMSLALVTDIKNPPGTTDADMRELGRSVCADLDDGVTVEGVAIIMLAADLFTPEESGQLLAVSIHSYCPQYEDELSAFTGAVA